MQKLCYSAHIGEHERDKAMTLSDVYGKLDSMEDTAAIVKIDNTWYFVVELANNTKYFYTAVLTQDGTLRHETLQRDHPVTIITVDQCADYGLVA